MVFLINLLSFKASCLPIDKQERTELYKSIQEKNDGSIIYFLLVMVFCLRGELFKL